MTGPPDDDLPRAPIESEVDGIAYGEWPGEEPSFLLLHGISANHRAFLSVAPALAPHRVVAVDLRGRGRSRRDGPFGLEAHAHDANAVADALGMRGSVIAGHSLGAYIAVVAAAADPDRYIALGLIDGGIWPPWEVPAQTIRDALQTSIARLGRPFASLDAYAAYWSDSALALADTPERRSAHARDLLGEPGAYTASTSAEAFDADFNGIGAHQGKNALFQQLSCPIGVVRAALGLNGDPASAIIPDPALEAARPLLGQLRLLDLERANHYDVVDDPHAEPVAALLRGLVA